MADEHGVRELGSAADLRVEHLVETLRCSTEALAVSLRSLRKRPDNPVYLGSTRDQAASCHEALAELVACDPVAYGEPIAREVLGAIEPLVVAWERATTEAGAPPLPSALQRVVDALFAEEAVDRAGRPCASVERFLARWCAVPEAPVAPAAPTATSEAEPPRPEVLFETKFTHGDGAPKDHLGRAYLALLVHKRGLSPEAAAEQVHAQALVGFDRSLAAALDGYAGVVCFRLVRHADGVRSELHRVAAGAPGPPGPAAPSGADGEADGGPGSADADSAPGLARERASASAG